MEIRRFRLVPIVREEVRPVATLARVVRRHPRAMPKGRGEKNMIIEIKEPECFGSDAEDTAPKCERCKLATECAKEAERLGLDPR